MKFTQIPATTFKNIQLNAGILVTGFSPDTQEFTGLLGATTGGISFNATPSFEDFGEDIDNCPKNTMELKKLTEWEVSMSGTFVTMTKETAHKLVGAADIDGIKIIPRKDVLLTDFADIWWIGDYSDVNTGENAGYCAVHMLNALNTGGFQIQSNDKGKGNFAFEFTGHVSMDAQDVVPFEIYIKGSDDEPTPQILLNMHSATVDVDDTLTLVATTVPEGSTVTWASSDGTKASVTSGGVVTGEAEGSATITASITVEGVTYTDTCSVVVEAGV